MSGYEEQSILKQRIWRMQILNTRSHHALLLFSLLGLVLLTFILYQRFSFVDDNKLAGWTVISITIIAISSALNNHLNNREHRVSPKFFDLYLLSSAFVLGGILASGQILFHPNVKPFTTDGNMVESSINLFGLVLLFSHMLALICYTDRYRLFCVFVITSLSPLIFNEIIEDKHLLLQPHNIMINVYVIFMLFCGYKMHRMRTKSAWLVIRNENLIDYMESSKEQTEHINSQLEEEMRQRVYTEEKLQESNAHLEEKILDRTRDLTETNIQLQSSQQRLEMAHSAGGIGTWDWDIKKREMHSTNFEQILGYKNDEMDTFIGDMSKVIHPEDYPTVRKSITSHLLNHTDRYEAEFRMRHKYGYWVWVQDMGRVVQRNSKSRFAERMVGVRRNITAEKASDERQKLASTVFQQAAEGIVILDKNMTYINVNPYFERMTGFQKELLIGKELFTSDRTPNTASSAEQQSKNKIVKNLHSTGQYEGEIQIQHKNGDDIPVWLHINPIFDHNHQKTHYIAILNDLTERKKNEQRLSYLSNYDPLTDLPNRHFFKEHMHQIILKSLESNTTFALLRLNIDRFRLLNDLLGTDGADILLKHVAQRLSTYDTRTSMIARIGSDDFAIMVPYPRENEKDIEQYCERLLEVFNSPFDVRSQEITVTISIGVALCPKHGKQVDTLSNSSENALQEAKRLGGNAIRFSSNQGGIQSLERVNLENALRKAISNTEFVVFYQPKLNAVSRRIEGFEALVRWSHPTKGIVAPVQFIGLAEEMGIISALGEFVLDQACSQIKKWRDLGFKHISIAVNVSAQQLQRGNFLDTLDRVLADHQIDPGLLELEITETLLMVDTDQVQAILQEIKRRGVTIALDDFGTGYSSLSYLGLYPIDVIKIDRSFVIQMIGNEEQKAIVRAILAMSKALKMKVVAEGVETLEQAQFLREEGCELLQGYLFSKPVPAFEANKLLINSLGDNVMPMQMQS
jgi:diguanylate cyclase (GGDEF)-like protein/PAS domain S-box-containing protein